LIVAASRGAADDLARSMARRHGATFGLTRFSLTELAARAAASRLARARRAASTDVGGQAMAARAAFDALAAGELTYFDPVAFMPGFPRALARTLHELRLAGVAAGRLAHAGEGAADVARLLARVEEQLAQAGAEDRAALFRLGAEAVAAGDVRWSGLPLVLLDLTADSRAELLFLDALVRRAPDVLATIPDGDDRARDGFVAMGGTVEHADDAAAAGSDLAHLRRYLFTPARPPRRERTGDVRLFSAPGEGREALEIVRLALDEAARGVRFDEMAVFLRAPQQYIGLLEHASARAGVPMYFDRGTRRPDPAGRAFLALLGCAVDGLSARRFDEYLSLGQVPQFSGRERAGDAIRPRDDMMFELTPDVDDGESPPGLSRGAPIDSDDEAIVEGTLRAPWKWEELIVESAVVGGRTRSEGKARWRRRLDGLAGEYRIRLEAMEREEPEDPRIPRVRRDLRNLSHLRGFALPIVDTLADWPDRARWSEWLDAFDALAMRSLRQPGRVRQVLADLRPMGSVGPVTLEEARDVLKDWLNTLDRDPPARRYGRIFVGTPHQARGRLFKVVFVPGLAERIVPQRPHEDPLLLDEVRARLDANLINQEARGSAERLLLRIAIGAASDRVYLSYPRMDVGETRARVPSFYALDVMRAMTGRVPDYRVLAAEAAEEAGATLGWPAPVDPDRAVDDLEHDLAVLKPLLESRDPAAVKGRAHYMLGLNEALRRSVVSRWARGRSAWSSSDGLVRVTPETASSIRARRLGSRPYSLSALQRFAVCPYQFLLASIHRLETWEEPEPLVRLDPLTRGSIFHRIQADCYRLLEERHALPLTAGALPESVRLLDEVVDRVGREYAERLAPAIERVWDDEIADLRRDLGIWMQKLAEDREWVPELFEFSFGLSDEGRDPRSVKEPVLVDGRFLLRGAVDVIEHHHALNVLRITDHKTGRNRSTPELIVGGGATLQPVLYGLAVEQALQKKVIEGRLFYATTVGGFVDHRIPLNDYTRGQGLQVLTIIDRAIEQGFLPAAPQKDACRWCDYRPVCGPREEERSARKSPDRLADVKALRAMR
jgi:CRISPR/Cas system-associated exonuclease Cas4 (RecB family)